MAKAGNMKFKKTGRQEDKEVRRQEDRKVRRQKFKNNKYQQVLKHPKQFEEQAHIYRFLLFTFYLLLGWGPAKRYSR